jgi:hypothetical protein
LLLEGRAMGLAGMGLAGPVGEKLEGGQGMGTGRRKEETAKAGELVE